MYFGPRRTGYCNTTTHKEGIPKVLKYYDEHFWDYHHLGCTQDCQHNHNYHVGCWSDVDLFSGKTLHKCPCWQKCQNSYSRGFCPEYFVELVQEHENMHGEKVCCHVKKRGNDWFLETKPKCTACESAFELLKEIMIDPHSDKTYWSNCNFPEDFRDYWQLTKAFMPGGNTNIDDPFKFDPVALLTVMNKCRLFDVETELIDKIISKRNGFVHIGSEKASITTEQTDEFFELIIRFLTSLNGWFDCEENKAKIEKIKESEVTAEMFTKANAKHVQSLLNTLSDHTAAGNDISKIVSDVECTIKDKVKVEIVETYEKDPELQNDLTMKLAKQELVNYDQERMINAQNITIDNLRIEKSNIEQEKSDLEMKLETREHTIVTQEGTIRQLRTDYQSNSILFNYLVIICIAASIFLAMLLY